MNISTHHVALDVETPFQSVSDPTFLGHRRPSIVFRIVSNRHVLEAGLDAT